MSMSDSEIDELLERLDQTEPKLQRRIIAKLTEKAALAEKFLEACEAIDAIDCCEGYTFPDSDWPKLWDALSKARAAIAFAKDKGFCS